MKFALEKIVASLSSRNEVGALLVKLGKYFIFTSFAVLKRSAAGALVSSDTNSVSSDTEPASRDTARVSRDRLFTLLLRRHPS